MGFEQIPYFKYYFTHVRHPAPYASFDASNQVKNAVNFLIDEAYNFYLVIKLTKISYRLRGNHPKYPNNHKATQKNNYVCKFCTGKI